MRDIERLIKSLEKHKDTDQPIRLIVIDTLIGIFLGGLLGVLLVFGREYVRRARVYRPAEFGEVSRLLRLTSSSGS